MGLPIAEWVWREMAIEVHCDDGDILTKWEGKAQIGICGFTPEKANGGIKIKVTCDAPQYRGLVGGAQA